MVGQFFRSLQITADGLKALANDGYENSEVNIPGTRPTKNALLGEKTLLAAVAHARASPSNTSATKQRRYGVVLFALAGKGQDPGSRDSHWSILLSL